LATKPAKPKSGIPTATIRMSKEKVAARESFPLTLRRIRRCMGMAMAAKTAARKSVIRKLRTIQTKRMEMSRTRTRRKRRWDRSMSGVQGPEYVHIIARAPYSKPCVVKIGF